MGDGQRGDEYNAPQSGAPEARVPVISYDVCRLRQMLPRVVSSCMAYSSLACFDDELVKGVLEFYGLELDIATAEAEILDIECERVRFYPWFLWDWRTHPQ